MEHLLQIHAGAERVAGAGEHQNAHRLVIAQRLERRGHVVVEARIHRVLLFRPVEADDRDAVRNLDQERLVVHGGRLPY